MFNIGWGDDYMRSNQLLKNAGTGHTSMSVGDVIQIGNKYLYVDNTGFKELEKE